MADTKFKLREKIEKVEAMKRTLPIVLANQARTFFVDSWDRQGFNDVGLMPWPPRKEETSETEGKAILVASGALRRAVRNSIRDVSFDKIRLVVDLPYAAIHNEGGAGLAFGKYPFVMPQRKFMGQSRALAALQVETIKKYLAKI
jgi:phage gpG-like protein